MTDILSSSSPSAAADASKHEPGGQLVSHATPVRTLARHCKSGEGPATLWRRDRCSLKLRTPQDSPETDSSSNHSAASTQVLATCLRWSRQLHTDSNPRPKLQHAVTSKATSEQLRLARTQIRWRPPRPAVGTLGQLHAGWKQGEGGKLSVFVV